MLPRLVWNTELWFPANLRSFQSACECYLHNIYNVAFSWHSLKPVVFARDSRRLRMGAVAHAYNPTTLGGLDRRIAWAQEFETSLNNIVSPPSLLKIKKQLAGCCGAISDTQEMEGGGWLELRSWRLQWAVIMPLSSSPGNIAKLCLKKKKKKRKSNNNYKS